MLQKYFVSIILATSAITGSQNPWEVPIPKHPTSNQQDNDIAPSAPRSAPVPERKQEIPVAPKTESDIEVVVRKNIRGSLPPFVQFQDVPTNKLTQHEQYLRHVTQALMCPRSWFNLQKSINRLEVELQTLKQESGTEPSLFSNRQQREQYAKAQQAKRDIIRSHAVRLS